MTNLNGFITRIEAQAKYDRSKTSFIRDVDQARERGDLEFLNCFMVVMKDDTSLSGIEATKQALKDNDHLKPEWYIRESLLEKRYWLKGKKAKPKHRQESEKQKPPESEGDSEPKRRSGDPYVVLLEQTNADLRAQTKKQLELISELTDHQKQSNVLVKSLTDLISGNSSEEAISALGMKVRTAVGNDKPIVEAKSIEIVDAEQSARGQDEPQTASEPKASARGANDAQQKPFWNRDIFWIVNRYFDK